MRWVIPDVHGCARTLQVLLQQISPSKKDELFFLGDLIDKGPDSAGVLNTVIGLQEEGFTIKAVRGNHEENLLYAQDNYNPRTRAAFIGKINKSANLLVGTDVNPRYLGWIRQLPYYFELPDCWIVHAGFNTINDDIFADTIAMLEGRMPVYDEEKLKAKPIIRGHQVTSLDEILLTIANRGPIISLDNGCIYAKRQHRHNITNIGRLLALNLDTFELKWAENIDYD
jgi:serine/threonine protein phosphatase 1